MATISNESYSHTFIPGYAQSDFVFRKIKKKTTKKYFQK